MSVVSGMTLASRLLGLVREVVFARFFGAGVGMAGESGTSSSTARSGLTGGLLGAGIGAAAAAGDLRTAIEQAQAGDIEGSVERLNAIDSIPISLARWEMTGLDDQVDN